ncbi:DUF1707 SHOCT-like domain-containing protein [Micromonospora rubida]|uniref:DUF1707 SHOCT-like domain-containing protein n=1 Tax=Micromonospora rubida TaxID=2697657 RepID=UPI0013784FBC|nr:DUF1707 domain-containing protein [Micromonospora rubida]NBE80814.1 DUF1707 domain-containing protein [Micromonospora rubida]
MEGRDGMRAADTDRQVVADQLRAAVDEGRLDLHEYDERLQRAYTSRTYGELDALVTDLPMPAAPAASELATVPAAVPSAAERAQSSVTVRWLAEVWLPYLRVVAIVVTVWAVTSTLATDLLYFWPAWVAGPWGAVLLVRTVAGLTAGEPRRWAVEQERRREYRLAKRARKRARKLAAAAEEHERRWPSAAGNPQHPGLGPSSGEDPRGPTGELPVGERERRRGEADAEV